MTQEERQRLLDCLFNILHAINQSPDISKQSKDDVYTSIQALKKESK